MSTIKSGIGKAFMTKCNNLTGRALQSQIPQLSLSPCQCMLLHERACVCAAGRMACIRRCRSSGHGSLASSLLSSPTTSDHETFSPQPSQGNSSLSLASWLYHPAAITVPYPTLYKLSVFYIIAMISDSYYLISILLCFYVWLRNMSTFNTRTWWWW